MHIRSLAATAMGGSPMFAMAERHQAVNTFASPEDNAATISTVTAAGAAVLDVFFASKGYTAVSAFSGFDLNFRAIDKHDLTDWDGPKTSVARRFAAPS
jgi:hypothetical protein